MTTQDKIESLQLCIADGLAAETEFRTLCMGRFAAEAAECVAEARKQLNALYEANLEPDMKPCLVCGDVVDWNESAYCEDDRWCS